MKHSDARSVYLLKLFTHVPEESVEELKGRISGILCPDPDHEPPCPVPWSIRSPGFPEEEKGGRIISFVIYATKFQANEFRDAVQLLGEGEVQLFHSVDENGVAIDGSTVIEQYEIEHEQ